MGNSAARARVVNWVPDDQVTQCTICEASFSFFRRRHHCRFCGGIFCNECCATRVALPYIGLPGEHRVCDACESVLRTKHELYAKEVLNIKFFIRNGGHAYRRPYPYLEIGHRDPSAKAFFVLNSVEHKRRVMLSSIRVSESMRAALSQKDTQATLLAVLRAVQHQFVSCVLDVRIVNDKAMVVRDVYPGGSVRDSMFKKPWSQAHAHKYHGSAAPLPLETVRLYSGMLLRAIEFLLAARIPVNHVHTCNVMLTDVGICLSDWENAFFGLPPRLAKVLPPKAPPGVFELGHFIYECAVGVPLNAVQFTADDVAFVERRFPEELVDVLVGIFGDGTRSDASAACITLQDLQRMQFFASCPPRTPNTLLPQWRNDELLIIQQMRSAWRPGAVGLLSSAGVASSLSPSVVGAGASTSAPSGAAAAASSSASRRAVAPSTSGDAGGGARSRSRQRKGSNADDTGAERSHSHHRQHRRRSHHRETENGDASGGGAGRRHRSSSRPRSGDESTAEDEITTSTFASHSERSARRQRDAQPSARPVGAAPAVANGGSAGGSGEVGSGVMHVQTPSKFAFRAPSFTADSPVAQRAAADGGSARRGAPPADLDGSAPPAGQTSQRPRTPSRGERTAPQPIAREPTQSMMNIAESVARRTGLSVTEVVSVLENLDDETLADGVREAYGSMAPAILQQIGVLDERAGEQQPAGDGESSESWDPDA